MTQMIRHHTDLADAKARAVVPQIKAAQSKPHPDEMTLGLMMAKLARKEGHRGKLPVAYGTGEGSGNGLPQTDIAETMRKVMTIEMTPKEIAASCAALLGREVSPQIINDRLRKGMAAHVVSRMQTSKRRVWKLK